MKPTTLIMYMTAFVIALACAGGAFKVYKNNADKKEAARIRTEEKAAADQRFEADRKSKMDEVTKRMADDLAAINARAAKLEEEREQEKERERKAKADELDRAQKYIEWSQDYKDKSKVNSISNRLVNLLGEEGQLKLSLVECPYPEKIKTIEDKLEKCVAEIKLEKEQYSKLSNQYDSRRKLRLSLAGCNDPEKRQAIEDELDKPISE